MRQYGVEEKFVRVSEGQWDGNVDGMNGGKSRWFGVERRLRQGYPLLPLLFNIYLMRMAEELE